MTATMNRFIAIIEDPSRVWTNYAVIDTHKGIRICQCSDSKDADEIAACMNIQYRDRETKLLTDQTR